MRWGVIGTGNMGGILIDAWMNSNVMEEKDLFITNRSIQKAYQYKESYPRIQVCEQVDQLVKEVDIIYICVKPLEIYPLLTEIGPYLNKDQCIVSITSPFSVERLESLVPCQVARMIPSITNRALAGITLTTFGERVTKEMQGYLTQSSRLYSKPVSIENNVTRVSSDIVSCGPAFFGYLAEQFIKAASEETEISKETATILTEEMFIGFGKLLADGHFTLTELIEKVCVKGGVTGEGIGSMEQDIGKLFHHLFQHTHNKYNEDIEKIGAQLTN
ncbi:late competence protein ComER [Aquibacillus sp. 3ASR75-11]|uniref:Late competence protein ComER n=1 Tax=Terrihalobacillus insolitus TaxID=2950438 RepID=A0A9X3WWX7_9BACI|nr:late competence protein ComER [Terrihalobacillus insolitus]MDC3413321.1 late competence protein ComER [Terrihalobacillus insolitus]MDC3424904.1 late competence protein ComER [Terrihalobacillus insolitus]